MLEPELVADCVRRMRDAVPAAVPVTVKCRIGIDARDDYEFLAGFADTLVGRASMRSSCMRAWRCSAA